MNVNNVAIKTYSPTNMFKFNCPIFNTDVEIRQCLVLRDLVWKGRSPEVRVGCQACMSASKCPIVAMVRTMNEEKDDYYSATPKVGHLDIGLLNHISPIMVPEQLLTSERFAGISEPHLKAIRQANIDAVQVKSSAAPLKRAGKPKSFDPVSLESVEANKPIVTTPAAPAAQDYAALVNVTMKEEK